MAEFRMPSLGPDMEAGTLVEWLVKVGDRVKRGDVVAVVDTQKGAIEVEIYQSGQIEQLLVDLDTKVPVGTPLARLRVEGEAPAAAAIPPVHPAAAAEVPAAAVIPPIRPAAPAAPLPARAHGRRRLHGGSRNSAASTFRPSPAAARAARSPTTTSSARSARLPAKLPLCPKSGGLRGSTSERCGQPSLRRWRARNGKSRTTTWSTRSM